MGMKYYFTARQLSSLEALLAGESLAAKKANLYAHSLLDPVLAERMAALSARHAARFFRLQSLLCAEGGADE